MTIRSVVSFAALAIAVLTGSTAPAAEHTKDSLATVKKNVNEEKAILVDVREKAEWDRGHIEGAVLLPLSALKGGIDKEQLDRRLPEQKILYTHCAVGKRSLTAGDILEDLGYQVRCLKPGYQELLEAGFPKATD